MEPPSKTLRVLLVDDSADDAVIVSQELRRDGRQVDIERVWNAEAMKAALRSRTWDLVLSDWTMPTFSGGAALEVLNAEALDVPFIIVSGTVTEELAIKAMQSGARDWVVKGKLARLMPAIDRELAERAERKLAAEDMRRSKEQLSQSQKLHVLGGVAAGIAHNFNNMISVIISHADILLHDSPPSDASQESLEAIRGAATRAANLTRQLLAFSEQQDLQPQRTDLSRLVVGVSQMLPRLLGETIELMIVVAPQCWVFADPAQMEQVILNLAVNARDAMPEGGTLTIETAQLDEDLNVVEYDGRPRAAGEEVKATGVQLSVTDSGVGMDASTQARVFEPFFTTKEPGKSAGLGLATVFGIVRQSGGTVSMTSAVGGGTTFKIFLPSVAGSQVAAPPSALEGGTEDQLSQAASPRGDLNLKKKPYEKPALFEVALRPEGICPRSPDAVARPRHRGRLTATRRRRRAKR